MAARQLKTLNMRCEIDEMPDEENYETFAGFMMYSLRKIPRPADSVVFDGL